MLKIIPIAALIAGCTSNEVVQPVAQEQQVPEPPPYVAQVNTVGTANPSAKVAHVNYKQVVLDGVAASSVVVTDVRRSRTNDGYERAQVLVKNVTAVPIRVRYRFDWQDKDGVIISDPDNQAWEKLTLAPGQDGTFTSIAPRKDCADFRLGMKIVQ